MIRIGNGFDVHKLVENRRLVLCGVEIPYELGLLGHSDADVAIHALMDALIGALALGDIGKHFPDNDSSYKDIDSMILFEKVLALKEFTNWNISNIDLTIIAQRPKLGQYREQMRENIAKVAKLDISQVSVKFTTTEKLGFTGRGEGIASMASVLLESKC
jgi:2-C-methyl-D-erythritol 2,4-cyclodiphosphate synthase